MPVHPASWSQATSWLALVTGWGDGEGAEGKFSVIAGGRTTESFLHTVFREHSIGGEWFRLGDDLREAIVSAAIPRLKGSLEDEEDQYRGWIAYEAERLGFLPIEDDPPPGSRNVPGPQEEIEQ